MKNIMKKTVAHGLIMILLTTAVIVTQIPIHAEDISVEWEVTLHFNESGGRYDYVVFGESSDACDGPTGSGPSGNDVYDAQKPPAPQMPYLRAWFDDGLDIPFNCLHADYRQYPATSKVWILSVMWMSEPGNESSTNIDISWNTSKIVESGYESVLLRGDDDTVVADMTTENHYNFASSSGLNHFQIICQSGSGSGTVDNNDTPFLYIILILIIIISALFISFVVYRKKNK